MRGSGSVTAMSERDAAEVNLAGGGPNESGPRINAQYFTSLPGVTKIVQLVLGLTCQITGTEENDAGDWFVFVTKLAFLATLIWSLLYLFYVRESFKIQTKYWTGVEILTTGIFPILLFSAFIGELAWPYRPLYYVAGIFGLLDAIAYGAGTTFLVLEYFNEPLPSPSDLLPT
ncbi:hypothetical protein QAD02_000342 [Eretmocerus hayati]|uniref:Uncharacterized protein n=1 Tax=Eretmocerus hayati TaxID=131215 RepID=A0ACC2ND82_9HYME|nr:hypothetical protein QAD02_000342 [Eretmocerus hayati]